MKKNKKIKTGGVALADGIIFLSERRQAVVERKNNRIVGKTTTIVKSKEFVSKIPILRGIVNLRNQLAGATGKFSASINDGEVLSGKAIIISYILIIICMIAIPIAISAAFASQYRNLVQLIGIIVEISIYAILLLTNKSMNQVYKYHGAEHKAVNAYEKCKSIDELTLENIKKSSRIHKRCGGNLVMYVIFFILLSVMFPINNLFFKWLAMSIFAIVSIGLSYEIIALFSLLPKPLDIINYPACIIQLITTKEPTDDMLEIAKIGIIASVREKDKSVVEIVKEIKEKYNKIDTQDIYSIIESVLNRERNDIILNKESYTISLDKELDIKYIVDKYINEDYPLQYLTHKQYFYNEEYYVDENVLIPRPDTEILVEKAIEYINSEENIKSIIDLCTGSGAIGISIAKNVEKAINVELVDISHGALNVANRNITKNNVQEKVHTLYSDLLTCKIADIKENEDDKVDMIVSNPPYIKSKDMASLDKNVLKEPHLALDGGEDGMMFYNKIVEQAKLVLNENGLLIFEIGYDELEQMRNLIYNNQEFKIIEEVKDYGGNDRVVICRFQQI